MGEGREKKMEKKKMKKNDYLHDQPKEMGEPNPSLTICVHDLYSYAVTQIKEDAFGMVKATVDIGGRRKVGFFFQKRKKLLWAVYTKRTEPSGASGSAFDASALLAFCLFLLLNKPHFLPEELMLP